MNKDLEAATQLHPAGRVAPCRRICMSAAPWRGVPNGWPPTSARQEDVNPAAVKYLNRLSDWFFVAARTANNGGKDGRSVGARRQPLIPRPPA